MEAACDMRKGPEGLPAAGSAEVDTNAGFLREGEL